MVVHEDSLCIHGPEVAIALVGKAWHWVTGSAHSSSANPPALASHHAPQVTGFYDYHNFGLKQAATPDVRLVDAQGTLSNAGLLQVRTDGGFGSVCGMNPAAADTVCRTLGYSSGSVATTPCSHWGGSNHCGAEGSPVAVADLQCTGHELMGIQDCTFKMPDETCQNHQQDSIVYCVTGKEGPQDGDLRMLDSFGAPSINGQGRLESYHDGEWAPVCRDGLTDGSVNVACKQMGFDAVKEQGSQDCSNVNGHNFCGTKAPHTQLYCAGNEKHISECSREQGEDVYCSPSESAVISCAGEGDASGLHMPKEAPTTLSSVAEAASMHPLLAVLASIGNQGFCRSRPDCIENFL